MWTSKFWKQLGERSVKSFVGAIGSYFGISAIGGFDALHANWPDALNFGVGAIVATVVLGIASANIGESDSPSAIDAE